VESVVAQHGEDTTTTIEPIFFSNMRLDQLIQAEKVREKQCSGSVGSLVFGPSGSVSQRYGSRFFHQQAKIIRKILISTFL
jgi:hypothetical protein